MEPRATQPEEESSLLRQLKGGSGLAWIAVIVGLILVARLTPIGPLRSFFDGFGWLTEQALRLARDLFESYGYLATFLAPLLENTLLLGALIPGVLIMLLAGLSAHDGLISLGLAIPLGIAGAVIGDTISYGIGRFGWRRLGPKSRMVRWAERMREPLLEQSGWLVLFYHFFGYSRIIGPAAAGFIRMPFPRWLLLDYAGASLWVVVFMMGGYLLGVSGLSLEETDRNVRVFEILLFALFVLWVLVLVSGNARRRRQQRGETIAVSEPAGASSDGPRPELAPALDPADPPPEAEPRERGG